MVMNDRHPACLFNVNQPSHYWVMAVSKFDDENQCQGHACGQRSHCWLSNQSIDFLFVSQKSTLTFLRYKQLKIWPWKSKVKVMTRVKTNGSIRGVVFNRYVRFVAIRSFCCKILQIAYSNLKGQGHGQGQSHWSHFRPRIQLMCLLFISWQSDHL